MMIELRGTSDTRCCARTPDRAVEMPKVETNDRVDTMFRAFSDRTRLRILHLLLSGETCVGDIVERFRLAPSTISHHIKELALAGLVRVERNGQFIRVFPNPEALKAISTFSDSLAGEIESR